MTYQYTFSDIDLAVQLLRRYAKARVPIPDGLYNVVNNMCAEDQRLTIYFYHRLLRFPSLKRYCLQSNPAIEDAVDEDGCAPVPLQVMPVEPIQHEMMFH
jgi:hypothetical protein